MNFLNLQELILPVSHKYIQGSNVISKVLLKRGTF